MTEGEACDYFMAAGDGSWSCAWPKGHRFGHAPDGPLESKEHARYVLCNEYGRLTADRAWWADHALNAPRATEGERESISAAMLTGDIDAVMAAVEPMLTRQINERLEEERQDAIEMLKRIKANFAIGRRRPEKDPMEVLEFAIRMEDESIRRRNGRPFANETTSEGGA